MPCSSARRPHRSHAHVRVQHHRRHRPARAQPRPRRRRRRHLRHGRASTWSAWPESQYLRERCRCRSTAIGRCSARSPGRPQVGIASARVRSSPASPAPTTCTPTASATSSTRTTSEVLDSIAAVRKPLLGGYADVAGVVVRAVGLAGAPDVRRCRHVRSARARRRRHPWSPRRCGGGSAGHAGGVGGGRRRRSPGRPGGPGSRTCLGPGDLRAAVMSATARCLAPDLSAARSSGLTSAKGSDAH